MEFKITADLGAGKNLIEKYPAASAEAQRSRVTEASLLMERAIKLLTPEGAGPIHLRDTVFHKVEAYGTSVRGLIGTPASYGVPVEMGTRPHFPPVEPIQHWVEKKIGLSGAEARSVAFLIARAISRRGTTGAKMFTHSIEDHEAEVLAILEKIPEDILRRISS